MSQNRTADMMNMHATELRQQGSVEFATKQAFVTDNEKVRIIKLANDILSATDTVDLDENLRNTVSLITK